MYWKSEKDNSFVETASYENKHLILFKNLLRSINEIEINLKELKPDCEYEFRLFAIEHKEIANITFKYNWKFFQVKN